MPDRDNFKAVGGKSGRKFVSMADFSLDIARILGYNKFHVKIFVIYAGGWENKMRAVFCL